jgi:GntR family transcriptional regulator
VAPGALPELDRDAESPLWFQIMRAIEFGISTGLWAPGEKLPSEHELCEKFRVSRTSVRGALARLEQQGLVSRRQGQGAFVEQRRSAWSWALPDAPSLLGEFRDGDRSALTSRVLRGEVGQLPPWAAAALQGFGDTDGLVIERLRSVGKLTAVHVVDYLPRRFAGLLPNLRDPRASLFAALERVAGVRISRMHRTIEAVSADRRLSGLLEVEEGYPLVVVEGVAYDEHDTPIDVSRAIVRTDRLRVSVDSGHAVSRSEEATHPPSGSYPELEVARARHLRPYQAPNASGHQADAADTPAVPATRENE